MQHWSVVLNQWVYQFNYVHFYKIQLTEIAQDSHEESIHSFHKTSDAEGMIKKKN